MTVISSSVSASGAVLSCPVLYLAVKRISDDDDYYLDDVR